jgi:hypothetical protein
MDMSVVIAEVRQMLAKDDLLLGAIFREMENGVTNALQLTELTGAANRGVVYNYQKMVTSILEGTLPNSASVSRNAARSIARLIKDADVVSKPTLDYLNLTRARLIENAEAENAVQHDQKSIEVQSQALAQVASTIQNGIYVYSFPTYLHFGTVEDQDVYWLKIGSTRNSVWQRIVEQNRQTSMPEDPKLLRIYHKPDMKIEEVEKNFHTTLEAVGHERSAARRTKAGTEWFATTLEAIDATAKLMSLDIERYESVEENL